MMKSDVTKDGRFTYRQLNIFLSFRWSNGQYPPGFSKANKLALRKRAKSFETKKVLTFITQCGGGRENIQSGPPRGGGGGGGGRGGC